MSSIDPFHVFTVHGRELAFNPETLVVTNPADMSHHMSDGELQSNAATPFLGFQTLALILTDECNLQCAYCYERLRSEGGRSRRMDPALALKGIDLFLTLSGTRTASILLFGGEPMLWWENIPGLVQYATTEASRRDITLQWSISTNGTCLPDDALSFFNEHHFFFLIDIDGTEENHNRLRPYASDNGSYDTVRDTYQRLREKTTSPVMLRATATPEYPCVFDLFQSLEKLRPDSIAVFPSFFESSRWDRDDGRMQNLLDEYSRLAAHVLSQYIKNGSKGYPYAFPFSLFLSHLCAQEQKICYCNAYGQTLAVSPGGTLHPCVVMDGDDEFCFGDLNTGFQKDALQRWHTYSRMENRSACQRCWARTLCGGGCIAHSTLIRNTDESPSSFECTLISHLAELSIWLYAELLDRKPECFISLIPAFRNRAISEMNS